MVSITSRRIMLVLIAIVLLLTLASTLTDLIDGVPYSVSNLLEVNNRANLPTWYASVSLLLSALLLSFIAVSKKQTGDRFVRHWGGMALLFLLLSLDKSAAIHRPLARPLRAIFASGTYHTATAIAVIAFMAVFAVVYLRFFLHLPTQTRWLFLLSALVFLAGAIGLDSFNSFLHRGYQIGPVTASSYNLLSDLEALLEMSGILIFIYALLAYASQHARRIEIVFET